MQNIAQAIGGNNLANMAMGIGLNKAGQFFNTYQPSPSRIFSPQLRAYFDVETPTVRNKIIKLLLPFKSFQFDEQIKKLQLYLPVVSFMTFIMFSTILEGIISQIFTPQIGKTTIWVLIFTFIEVLLAKFSENAISQLNLSFVELISLVSYRFVSLSAVTIIIVLTNNSIPFSRYIGALYVLCVDTYYCKIQLSECSRKRFKEEGMGNRIALGVHMFTTAIMMWYCDTI